MSTNITTEEKNVKWFSSYSPGLYKQTDPQAKDIAAVGDGDFPRVFLGITYQSNFFVDKIPYKGGRHHRRIPKSSNSMYHLSGSY
jgi:hypothetical protein